jgi:N-methylhydantoinase A
MTQPAPSRCIGIDVGGTFTDGVLTDGSAVIHAKVPTTPDDMTRGVMQLCTVLAGRSGTSVAKLLESVSRFGVGTTSVTNVLAQRTGRRVGLITTRGFEATIPLARGRRVLDEQGWLVMPQPIVPAHWIAGVHERVDRHGTVLQAVSAGEVQAAARRLVEDEQVEAIVVSFLWAFRNSANENEAVEAVRALYPRLPVSSASALSPVIREYERTSVAVLNAYVGNGIAGVSSLRDELEAAGLGGTVLLMHSGGGATTLDEVRRFPLSLALSGPAAGVAAAATIAGLSGAHDVIACDMGGTSFEVAVIAGQLPRRTRGELLGMWTALPMVDVLSIGAGGGSIGWVDARGVLRVGPQSAGAVPGPACYGRGGREATVTDALVVLGYLDPANFLAGTMPLDPQQALGACARLGGRLGLDANETAWGIRQIAIEEMTRAVRSVTSARGIDPRKHALLSYGGAAGLFAAEIARAIGSPRVLSPETASILSAFGCAATDVMRERVRSVNAPLAGSEAIVSRAVADLRDQVIADLAADGVRESDREVRFQADLRFERQVYELSMELSDAPLDGTMLDRLATDFRTEYSRIYGRGVLVASVPIELVTLRAIGIGHTTAARFRRKTECVAAGTPAAPSGSRRVRLSRGDAELTRVHTYASADLLPGHSIVGPAVIDAVDTTLWLPASWSARIDEYGTCIMEAAP